MPNSEEPPYQNGPVGANIFRVRRKLRITQKELAAPEFSISYISAIERGRIRPSLRALDILARRLGVTSAELLADVPDDITPADTSGLEDDAAASRSLISLLSQRRPPSQAPLALVWASISLAQQNPQLASQILHLLSPGVITAEQRLLRLYFLGRVALATGHPDDAQATLEPILQQDEFSGHPQLLERCRFGLACAYEAQEKFLLAFDTFTACVQAIENGIVGDPLFAIEVYSALAEHHRRRERPDAAAACYQQVLRCFDFVLKPERLAESSARLGLQRLENIQSTLADWYAARTRVLLELDEARQSFTQAASNLGLTLQELGNSQAAEQQLRQTIPLCEQLGTPRQAVLARIALADLLLSRQEASEAERLALEGLALCRPGAADAGAGEIGDETLYGRVLVTLADTYKALNRRDEAERCFQQAIEILKTQQASEYLSHAYYRYSELLHQKGQDAESYEMVKQAYLLNQRKPEAGG
jgi:tetratricopeptide (TPR) repeat protein/DNA-binding XRE family transcriptional regulator